MIIDDFNAIHDVSKRFQLFLFLNTFQIFRYNQLKDMVLPIRLA